MSARPKIRDTFVRPIAWHEECLFNIRETLKMYEASLKDAQGRVDDCKANIEKLEAQIAKAKAKGLTEFDRLRFRP